MGLCYLPQGKRWEDVYHAYLVVHTRSEQNEPHV